MAPSGETASPIEGSEAVPTFSRGSETARGRAGATRPAADAGGRTTVTPFRDRRRDDDSAVVQTSSPDRLGALTTHPVASPQQPQPQQARQGRRLGLFGKLILTDVVGLQLAWWAFWLTTRGRFDAGFPLGRVALCGLVGTGTGLALLSLLQLYRSRVSAVRTTEIPRLGLVAIGTNAVALNAAMLSGIDLNLGLGALSALLTFVILTIGRSFYDEWLRARRSTGAYQRPIVLVGNGEEVQNLEELLSEHPDFGFQVKQVVRTTGHHDPTLLDRVGSALVRAGSQGVLLSSGGLYLDDKRRLISTLTQRGVHIHLSSGLWGIDHRRLRAVPVAHEPLLYVEPARTSRFPYRLKRLIDLVGSLAILVVASPVFLAGALGVLISDGRPILFRQQRVGLDGKTFEILKLRTMIEGAEGRLEEVRAENDRNGPLYKNDAGDPRVTRLGRILRALSIDELPQLFNVLRGEMSLVGPRPALPSEVVQFDEELQHRHQAKPGLTGLWQVEARDNPSFHAYRRLDLFYIENFSMMLDVVVLVLTAQSVIGRTFRFLVKRN